MSDKPKERIKEELLSVQRKMEVVLRLLRGVDLGELSRELQVPAPQLVNSRRVFMEWGELTQATIGFKTIGI